MIEAGHLGGYIAGGYEWTFYPDLWRWLPENLGVRSSSTRQLPSV